MYQYSEKCSGKTKPLRTPDQHQTAKAIYFMGTYVFCSLCKCANVNMCAVYDTCVYVRLCETISVQLNVGDLRKKSTSLVQICFEEKWLLSDVFVLFYCCFCCSSPLHLPNTTSNRHFSPGARFGEQFCKSFGIERKKKQETDQQKWKTRDYFYCAPATRARFSGGKNSGNERKICANSGDDWT